MRQEPRNGLTAALRVLLLVLCTFLVLGQSVDVKGGREERKDEEARIPPDTVERQGEGREEEGLWGDWLKQIRKCYPAPGALILVESTGDSFTIRARSEADIPLKIIGTKERGWLVIVPDSSGNADAEIFLAENRMGTCGMSFTYDGEDDKLYVYGHGMGESTRYGPHMAIDRITGHVNVSNRMTVAHELDVGGTLEVHFDYDSGWFAVSEGSELTLQHNLGGDPSNYIVFLDGKSKNGGIHQANLGLNPSGREPDTWIGCEWVGLTSSTIHIRRGDRDGEAAPSRDWSHARVRILKNQ
jgi:hypothetical protein